MSSERWQELVRLFHSALECEPEKRHLFIAEACDGDVELRRELESLLDHNGQARSFMESPLYPETLVNDESDKLAGKTVGSYQILSKLQGGGQGDVYLAIDSELHRRVALKFLRPDISSDARRIQRFKQEARAASALNHPNILTVYETGEIDGRQFIATEFVEGVTLRESMNRGKVILGEALEIATQIASALSAAHAAGIIHRDVKPENIMVRPDGYVKLVDFGVAKLTERKATESDASTLIRTDEGTAIGTVRYMSPEQVRTLDVDARTDIWSFGVVLYEMLSGSFPFEGDTAGDLIASILKSEPPPLSEPERISTAIKSIVGRALQKRVAERYQTASEMLIDLEAAQQEIAFPSKSKTVRPKGADGRRRTLINVLANHRQVMLVAALLLAATLAALIYLKGLSKRSEAIDSIAVMPLVNATGDPEMEYLGDGIAETVINDLSRLPSLKVIARSSTFTYKDRNIEPKVIGHDLGVRAVLTGHVEKKGDALVVGVELADASDNSHIWGEQYTRSLSDIFALREEIAENVSKKLRLKLTGQEVRLLQSRYSPNPQAYQLLLEGYYYHNKYTAEGLKKSVEIFKLAVEKDPNYALAYAGLSQAWFDLSGDYVPQSEAMPYARAAVLRALELDNELAEAHTAMAQIVSVTDWDWPESEKECRLAIQFNPGYAMAHLIYAESLMMRGRLTESLAEFKQARDLDPVNPALVMQSWALYLVGRPDEAIEQLQGSIKADSSFMLAHFYLGWIYAERGRYPEALGELEKAKADDENVGTRALIAYVHSRFGRRAQAEKILNELLNESQRPYTNAFQIAALQASLGNKTQAFEWLERAYREHADSVIWVKVDPRFSSLHADPRYLDLLRRLGLADDSVNVSRPAASVPPQK